MANMTAEQRFWRRRRRMRAKPPDKEGSLRRIFELFIEPLLKYKPEDWELREFISSYFFNAEERTIEKKKAAQDFKMPGALKVLPTRAIRGVGQRQIAKGSELWIRRDLPRKKVEIEIHSQVFIMSDYEFKKHVAEKLV